MLYTFGNSKSQFAPYVDTGRCSTDPAVLTWTNEAIMRLLMMDNWKLCVQKMTFKVTHNTICLPEFVDSIIALRTCCGTPSTAWNQFYEFSASGPGETTFNGNPGTDLVDMGRFPTFYPIEINSSLKLGLFSTAQSDIGKTVHIRGISAGREVLTGSTIGIDLKINRWRMGVEGDVDLDTAIYSTQTFSEVTHLVKPATTGYLSLMAWDPDTNVVQILGVYAPWETTPAIRRYKVMNHDHENGTVIVAACKMQYLPMRSDNDPLIIQNIPAIIATLQSMQHEKAGNVNMQIAFENKALQWMERQAVRLDDQKAVLSVTCHDWGMGDATQFN